MPDDGVGVSCLGPVSGSEELARQSSVSYHLFTIPTSGKLIFILMAYLNIRARITINVRPWLALETNFRLIV